MLFWSSGGSDLERVGERVTSLGKALRIELGTGVGGSLCLVLPQLTLRVYLSFSPFLGRVILLEVHCDSLEFSFPENCRFLLIMACQMALAGKEPSWREGCWRTDEGQRLDWRSPLEGEEGLFWRNPAREGIVDAPAESWVLYKVGMCL